MISELKKQVAEWAGLHEVDGIFKGSGGCPSLILLGSWFCSGSSQRKTHLLMTTTNFSYDDVISQSRAVRVSPAVPVGAQRFPVTPESCVFLSPFVLGGSSNISRTNGAGEPRAGRVSRSVN